MRIYSYKNKTGTVWGVDHINPVTGERIQRIIGTKQQALVYLANVQRHYDLYKLLGKKEYFENLDSTKEDITVAELVIKYLEFAKTAKRSFERDERSLKAIGDYNPFPGKQIQLRDLKLSEVTEKMISEYIGFRLSQVKYICRESAEKKCVQPPTVNREISCLKHIFNKAIEWNYLSSNPARKIKKFKEGNGMTRYLEKTEISKLIEACGTLKRAKYLKSVVITAINTGMRRGEILNLKWKDIDFSKGLIYISTSKNGESGYVPMNSVVVQTLKENYPINNTDDQRFLNEHVFMSGGKPLTEIRTAFKRALKVAGIESLRFHDLRHTAASHLIMNGVDLVTVKEILRHKCISQTLRYSHLSSEHKRNAVESLCGGENARKVQD